MRKSFLAYKLISHVHAHPRHGFDYGVPRAILPRSSLYRRPPSALTCIRLYVLASPPFNFRPLNLYFSTQMPRGDPTCHPQTASSHSAQRWRLRAFSMNSKIPMLHTCSPSLVSPHAVQIPLERYCPAKQFLRRVKRKRRFNLFLRHYRRLDGKQAKISNARPYLPPRLFILAIDTQNAICM